MNAVLGPTKDLMSHIRLKTLAKVFSATHQSILVTIWIFFFLNISKQILCTVHESWIISSFTRPLFGSNYFCTLLTKTGICDISLLFYLHFHTSHLEFRMSFIKAIVQSKSEHHRLLLSLLHDAPIYCVPCCCSQSTFKR